MTGLPDLRNARALRTGQLDIRKSCSGAAGPSLRSGGIALPLGPVGAVILHSVQVARPASGTNLPLHPVKSRC
jgi:hypothetical protein